jgi:hypothetical protein
MAVEWSGRRLPLFWAGTRRGGRRRYVTARVPLPAGDTTLRLTGDSPPPVARLDLHLWLPPATARGTGP